MNTEVALLDAIIANPAEDTPRLVYCDWLEENGQPERASFIRAQVDAARGSKLGSMQLWDLLHHAKDWFEAVCKPLRLDWDDWGVMHDETVHYESKHHGNEFFVSRGFVSALTCSWSDWHAHADAILKQQPVERVRLTTYPFQQEAIVPGKSRDELELELLRRRWPRIEFELPLPRSEDRYGHLRYLRDLAAAENL